MGRQEVGHMGNVKEYSEKTISVFGMGRGVRRVPLNVGDWGLARLG